MRYVTRGIVRWGLISAVALGGATLILGPDRIAAGFDQIKSTARAAVDRNVEDPVALRRQLREMAEVYPERIAEVRGELAEVESHLREFNHDIEVCQRAIAMTGEDLTQLKQLVTRAEEKAADVARPVSIRFDGSRFDLDEAYSEARRIHNARVAFEDRLAHNRKQADVLRQQRNRLKEIHDKLESEYTTYQSQLWQMDRQIDAIDRNNRLIEMTERLQETLDGYDKFGEVANLKQLEGKLAHLEAVQESQLEALTRDRRHRNYEDRATYELEDEAGSSFGNGEFDLHDDFDIEPSDLLDESDDKNDDKSRSYAWDGPLVIE